MVDFTPLEIKHWSLEDCPKRADEVYAALLSLQSCGATRAMIPDTHRFGEAGDGAEFGILPAVRRFLRENQEWTAISHDLEAGVLTISRRPEDIPHTPALWRKLLHFVPAATRHVLDGGGKVPDEVFERRIDLCILCARRSLNECAECGCDLNVKASWSSERCPLPVPKWEEHP